MTERAALGHSTSRTIAALLGALPVALAVGMALAYAVPLATTERYLLGTVAVLPLWAGASLWTFLAPSGRRAWGQLAVVLVVAVLVIVAARLAMPDPFRGARS